MGMQAARLVKAWADRTPDRPALWDDALEAPGYVTYAGLSERADAASAALSRRGLAPGDAVGLCATNSAAFVVSLLGAFGAGLVVVPIPTSSVTEEVGFRLARTKAKALLTDGSAVADVGSAELRALTIPIDALLDDRGAGRADASRVGARDLPPDADALLLFTSGTTGEPKAARIGHASLSAHTACLVQHALRLDARDVVLAALPLTHSFGLRVALLAPLFVGASVVLERKFSTAATRAALERSGVTFFPAVPTMLSALGRTEPLARDLPLRWVLSAGAPLAEATRLAAEAVLRAPVRQGFGLTEATFSTVASPSEPAEAGCVGVPVPGVECRIVDDAGRMLGAGEVGELQVRGQNVMTGYLDDAAATAAAFDVDWLRTGDLAKRDPHGRLFVVDRKKDLILRGGFNVVPAAVESACVAVPGVEAALVIGVPDEHQGEEIAALLVVDTKTFDHGGFVYALRQRLPTSHVPRLVAFTAALPCGPSGKALRREAASMLRAGRFALTPIDALSSTSALPVR